MSYLAPAVIQKLNNFSTECTSESAGNSGRGSTLISMLRSTSIAFIKRTSGKLQVKHSLTYNKVHHSGTTSENGENRETLKGSTQEFVELVEGVINHRKTLHGEELSIFDGKF